MKIGIIRGDFANPWEIQNFEGLTTKNDVTVFTSKTNRFWASARMTVERLHSPYEYFGHNKYSRAIMNRLIVDGHYLVGLEEKLKGFDIAHCAETYYSYTQQCIRAKNLGNVKKVVSTVWENIPFNNEGIHGRQQFKLNAFEHVDLFLVTTQRAREVLLVEGCKNEKIRVLNPGIDLTVFRPLKIKKHLGLEKNGKLKILFVGRLEEEKGILDLIADFKRLSKNHDLELVIAGNGLLMEKIEEETRNNSSIKILGNVRYEDMPKLYSMCDVLVHLAKGSKTWQEQYGMVLVEAIACGLPIVSVDSGSIKEVVGRLETSLEKVVDNPALRKDLSSYGLKRAEDRYDSQKYAKKLEQIYEDVLREN